MTNDEIWQAVLGEIELSLSKANFTTWFKNTFISSFENDKIIVCVPNTFTKTWLEKKYHKEISTALQNITNQKIKEVYYKIETRRINDDKKTNQINEILKKMKIKKNDSSEIARDISTNRFGLNSKYAFDNFIVGRGNELAHAACQAVTNNLGQAYNPLFIYGPVGLGKTHLLQAIGNEVSKFTDKVLYTTSEKFTNNYVQAIQSGKAKEFKNLYRNVDLLLVDDVQFMGGKDGTQEEFFHTFNELHQSNKQIVLSSDRPPKSLPAVEKRLISRFECGMVADIGQPDMETKVAILEKKSKEKNYFLNEDVLEYVAKNVQNNIRELEGALNKIIAYHELNNTTPSIKSVKNLLSDILTNTQQKNVTPKIIMDGVCNFYDISNKDLIGKVRKKELVWPRQVAIYLMREEINTSYPTIGAELGGRDHTTAMHAYNKISNELKNDNEKLKQEIESIKQLFYSTVF